MVEVSIGFGELVKAAFWAPPMPVLTSASCSAERSLTMDFGAGTKAGSSSIVAFTWLGAERGSLSIRGRVSLDWMLRQYSARERAL